MMTTGTVCVVGSTPAKVIPNQNKHDLQTFLAEDCDVSSRSDSNIYNKWISHNLVDYIQSRNEGLSRIQNQTVSKDFCTISALSKDALRERRIQLGNVNKVFCSQWLNENVIVMGTKCNKLQVYDITTKRITTIPALSSFDTSPEFLENQSGIHAIEINPSRTRLATGAQNSNDVAVYSLPTLDPLCVGTEAHKERIFDMCWLDDQFLISGSRDKTIALWKIDCDPYLSTEHKCPTVEEVKPLCVIRQSSDIVRSMFFNPNSCEIVTLSMNSLVHTWDPYALTHIKYHKLLHQQENVCMAANDDMSLYAVGSKSHITLLDSQRLKPIKQIKCSICDCSVRSLSFRGNILTIGTGQGVVLFYDVVAQKYLESSVQQCTHARLRCSTEEIAIYTHCYDSNGSRLFTAGGPLHMSTRGSYASLWS